VVDDENVDGGPAGFEFETELILESLVEGGGVIAVLATPGGESPVQGEVVEACEAGLVDNRSRDDSHAGHRRQGRGQQGERDAARAEACTRVLGGRNVGNDATNRRQTAEERWRELRSGDGGRLIRLRSCGTGIVCAVGPEIGAQNSAVNQDKGEAGSLAGLVVDHEVEAVGEESLHHQAHLVDAGVQGCAGLDVEGIGGAVESSGNPGGGSGLGQTGEVIEAEGEFLGSGKLVRERDVTPERLVGGDEQTAGGTAGVVGADRSVDIPGVEGDVGVLRRTGLAGTDRSGVESQRGPAGSGLGQSGGDGDEADGKLETE